MKHTPTRAASLAVFLGFLILSVLVSVVGGVMTANSIADWYPNLAKPTFNPPNWLFGPVWAVLYLMMATAAWRVWKHAGWHRAAGAIALYFLQLSVNLLWSGLFFGLRRPDLALADCLVLLTLIGATIWAFRRHDGLAAVLLLPYLAWVGFACLLNAAIVALN